MGTHPLTRWPLHLCTRLPFAARARWRLPKSPAGQPQRPAIRFPAGVPQTWRLGVLSAPSPARRRTPAPFTGLAGRKPFEHGTNNRATSSVAMRCGRVDAAHACCHAGSWVARDAPSVERHPCEDKVDRNRSKEVDPENAFSMPGCAGVSHVCASRLATPHHEAKLFAHTRDGMPEQVAWIAFVLQCNTVIVIKAGSEVGNVDLPI